MSGAGTARSLGLWSLRHRLVVAVAATLALVLVGLAASGLLLRRTRDEQSRITVDYFAAYSLAGEISTWLLDQESAVRGYALMREPSFLRGVVADPLAGDAYHRVLSSLREETQTREQLERVAESARRWQRDWVAPSLATLRRGEALPTGELIRGMVMSDEVRAAVRSYVDSLLAVRSAAAAELRRDTGLLFATVLAGVLGAVLAGLSLLVLLARWVTAPVEELARQTRAVAAGDLEHEVAVGGPPEIVMLGRDVDGMRRELLTKLEGLREAAEELERSRRRLEEQALELRRSNTELEQFAYVASHDLQEPLRKVASFCQMLARRYEGQLDERADQYIAFAVDGAKRMQQLINDLLAFSRVGRIGTGLVDVDLEACLATALRSLELAREETGARVTWDPLPTVRGEAGLLTQVFQNLVGNAIKFRGEDAPRVHIGAVRRDGHWELSCHDDGIGIEDAYAERIFVLFQRLHAKDDYAGTGIGLALCRKIIEHHGGRIWLDTGEDDGAGPRGTTFRWTIPVREEPVAGDEDGAAAAAVRGEVDR